jgi:hypothetical protein
VIGAENQVPDGGLVAGSTVDGQVALGTGLGEKSPFGLEDGRKHGRDAGLVDVDADREIDLAGSAVGLERLGQAENGIGRGWRQ